MKSVWHCIFPVSSTLLVLGLLAVTTSIGIHPTESFVLDSTLSIFKRRIVPSQQMFKILPHFAAAKFPNYRGYAGSDDDEDFPANMYIKDVSDSTRQRSTDRPTETLLGVQGPEVVPAKPKIVVLGATGRVGRLVVRQLLEMESTDMTIVAFVRNYDKAIRVLYDDMLVANANKKGPKLQIVEGDLVPSEELPGSRLYDQEDEEVWLQNAKSAAKYFGNKVQDYDNRELLPDINESLEEAIQGCTTVISCLGAFRPTNLWTDILERPFWRLLRPDVSRWCSDGRHPYYVHYASTRKVLGFIEREQRKREVATADLVEGGKVPVIVPRIRFIRISDLCVGQKPWHFVPLVTNAVQSIILRYHEMAEQLLESSSKVETVVLRPGDLVDDERDVNTTSLQVCHTGMVPFPARVSREDVASLAVAAAMFQTPTYETDDHGNHDDGNGIPNPEPFHYTLACRWAGQQLDPFPPQGVKADGAPDAVTALRRSLRLIAKNEKRKQVLQQRKGASALYQRTKQHLSRRKRPQPHGVFVAVPIYVMLGLFARTLLHPLVQVLPGGSTVVLPALVQLNQWLWMTASLLIGKFLPLRKQYISF